MYINAYNLFPKIFKYTLMDEIQLKSEVHYYSRPEGRVLRIHVQTAFQFVINLIFNNKNKLIHHFSKLKNHQFNSIRITNYAINL